MPVVIPRLIHRIWLGDADMHPLMQMWGLRWGELHPGWKMCLWRESEDGGVLVSGDLVVVPTVEQMDLLARSCHLSQRSNIWRYLIMFKYGGLYVDTDVEPYRPIDELVVDLRVFVARRWLPFVICETAFFGAVSGHAWLEQVVEEMGSCDSSVSLSLGVDYLTRITRAYPEVVILPASALVFQIPDWGVAKREGKLPQLDVPVSEGAYVKHHWSSVWYPKGFQHRDGM